MMKLDSSVSLAVTSLSLLLLLLIFLASACAFTLKVSHALILVEYLFLTTLLPGREGREERLQHLPIRQPHPAAVRGEAGQIMLATSCDSIYFKKRGSTMWSMTWQQALYVGP